MELRIRPESTSPFAKPNIAIHQLQRPRKKNAILLEVGFDAGVLLPGESTNRYAKIFGARLI